MKDILDFATSLVKQCDELLSVLSRRLVIVILCGIAAVPAFFHVSDDTAKAETRLASLAAPCALNKHDNPEIELQLPGQTPTDRAASLQRIRDQACRPAQRVQSTFWTPFLEIATDAIIAMWWGTFLVAPAIAFMLLGLLQLVWAPARDKVDELFVHSAPFLGRLLVVSTCLQLSVYAGRLGSFALASLHVLPQLAAAYQFIAEVGIGTACLLALAGLLVADRLTVFLHKTPSEPALASAAA